jgi:MFS family permease
MVVGIALSVAALAWIAASWLQERIDAYDHGVGRRVRVYVGRGVLAVGILAAGGAILWSSSPALVTAVAWGISGFGIGVAYPASTVLALHAVDAQQSGNAAASLQIAETLGTAAMRVWVGIDVAKEIHWATAIDDQGEVLLDGRVTNDPSSIRFAGSTTQDLDGELTIGLDVLR